MSTPDLYAVKEPIARSSRAVLYRAVRNVDHLPVVLKVLDPGRARPKDLERLKHEFALGQGCNSSAIVKPIALDRYQGMPALVLEDFGGRSLAHLIGAPMDVEQFLSLATRAAAATAELHQRDVVHKDLKPDNILVSEATGELKIADLGIASRLPRELTTASSPSRIEGSMPYISPEQTGWMNRSVDNRSDLYSLGVTFYEMLTGGLPFQARDPLEWVHCHVARTPRPPDEIVPTIPRVLSEIVLKLLAKMADERYQTARGLEHDLGRCLADWHSTGTLRPFALGEHDVPDRLQPPQKLYGRDPEVRTLREAFERVVERGTPELALVSGYSGIGKSSLVRELNRPIVQQRGYFISGKFDQYKRDIPYSTFAQAFGELVDQILGESEERLSVWREKLREALGSSGQLIVDIVPQVELIVGPQPAVLPLPPLEAQNRFHRIFREFVGVFARQDHPLALFLDDLQWLDSGSLQLIEDIITHPQTRHLLILGAFRDNEVGPSHPLIITLDKIRRGGAVVRELVLAPLTVEHMGQFTADALRTTPAHAALLARLVHDKTGGNPFFAIQFLTTLHQEGLLQLDRATRQWRWDVEKIAAKGFTDNVVELMVRKIRRLPAATQERLKLAACVGNSADLRTLAVISDQPEAATENELWEAVREGLMLRAREVYTFLHDRVQQGAYALIADDQKKAVHLRIGRVLLRSLDPRVMEERFFDVVNQLNLGATLVRTRAELDVLVQLNITAGAKAKNAIAYASARNFLVCASALLPVDAWSSRYELTFRLYMERAECEYLCGAFEEAEVSFELLLARATSDIDRARVYELRLKLYHVAGKYDEAVAMALTALRLFDLHFPDDDVALADATRAEAAAVKRNLGDRSIADLVDAPEARDERVRAIIGLLSNVAPAAYIGSRPQVFPLITLKLVNYSLRFGHTYESCMGYSAYGFMLVSLYDDPRAAYEFSEMSIRLNQKLGDISRRGTVLHLHGDHINFWTNHIRTDFPILERGFLACLDAGDLVFANYIAFEIVWQAIERGDTLDEVLALSEKYGAFARDSRNEAVHQTIRMERQFLACLQGRTRGSTSFSDESFDEAATLAKIANAAFMCGVVFHHMMKLIVAFLADDDAAALHHAREAEKTLGAAMAMPMEATFHYVRALVLARAVARCTDRAERSAFMRTIGEDQRKLAFWAQHCPDNFRTKEALVAAELARLSGDELGAERRYEEAIRSARANAFVPWEAVANEVTARFYLGRDLPTAANGYLREARQGYRRWGADAQVNRLEEQFPALREAPSFSPALTLAARPEQLDLLSVIKASQTISGEMVRDHLLRTLLQVVLEEGGARRARLILEREGELRIAAEATVEELARAPTEPAAARLPMSILQYVQRTQESVLLNDATSDAGRFAGDEYFRRVHPRSVLCLPIRRQAEVVALLYLENDLLAGAFTPERLLALELLATQAAISIENALFVERERAGRIEAEVASQRSLLLAEATALMSSGADYKGVFPAFTRLCVRSLADWAVIDLVEGDETVRLAGAHRDVAKEPLLREYERYPARVGAPSPVRRTIDRGEIVHVPSFEQAQIRAWAVDDHHAELAEELGARSFVTVPLVARDKLLGALTLVSGTPHHFAPADVELIAELARRAALVIDNARLLQETQQALQLREEFLAIASHELRTPMTSLQLAVEVLLHKSAGGGQVSPEMLNRQLSNVLRTTKRLRRLTSELLDVTRIEQRRLEVRRDEVDLAALVRGVVGHFDLDLATAGCPLTIECKTPVIGHWDALRLEQVVDNLLSNAIKFGAGRPIDIGIRRVAANAELVVTDHGIGIDPARQPYVFERFERAVSWVNYGGLGLGLYITRWIVHAHGGHIRVESALGAGATFTVELPCAPPAQAEGQAMVA